MTLHKKVVLVHTAPCEHIPHPGPVNIDLSLEVYCRSYTSKNKACHPGGSQCIDHQGWGEVTERGDLPTYINARRRENGEIGVRKRTSAKGLVISYRQGTTQWEIRGSKTCFAPLPPPPSRLFAPPTLKGGHLLRPPSLWLELQAPGLKLPQNMLTPSPFSRATPPFFLGVKFHLPSPPPVL